MFLTSEGEERLPDIRSPFWLMMCQHEPSPGSPQWFIPSEISFSSVAPLSLGLWDSTISMPECWAAGEETQWTNNEPWEEEEFYLWKIISVTCEEMLERYKTFVSSFSVSSSKFTIARKRVTILNLKREFLWMWLICNKLFVLYCNNNNNINKVL